MSNSFQKGPIQWEMKVSVRIARQPRQKVHTYDKYIQCYGAHSHALWETMNHGVIHIPHSDWQVDCTGTSKIV